MNISVSELARMVRSDTAELREEVKRETITLKELKVIADVMGVKFEQDFISARWQ